MHFTNIIWILIIALLCSGSSVVFSKTQELDALDLNSTIDDDKVGSNRIIFKDSEPPHKFMFMVYDRLMGLLDRVHVSDYRRAVREYFENDASFSLSRILEFADVLPHRRQTYVMYAELYESLRIDTRKNDRIEEYIDMWYAIGDGRRFQDSHWSELSQNLIASIVECLHRTGPQYCELDKNITWHDRMIDKKKDPQGVLFKKTMEQLYAADKDIAVNCFAKLLYRWEAIMPTAWMHKYVLQFDERPLRIEGLDFVKNMIREKYNNGENSLRNRYMYRLAVDMYGTMVEENMDESTYYGLRAMIGGVGKNIRNAVSMKSVCIRSNLSGQYLQVVPVKSDRGGARWKADLWTHGDVGVRGKWRFTPVMAGHTADDGFYLTNVRTGLDFSVLVNSDDAETEPEMESDHDASFIGAVKPADDVWGSGRKVYAFRGGDDYVTIVERDTKKTLGVAADDDDGQLKWVSADNTDTKYYKWTVEGC